MSKHSHLGGVIHTYQRYDPKNFPSPTQPPPDLVSPALEHMLMFGSMRELTEEELARAVRLDPSQISGLGPSIDALIALLRDFRARHDVELYIEPGEAIAYHAGVLVSEVLDLPVNGMPLAILDTSATCHMPDVIEMPYRPNVLDAADPCTRPHMTHRYRLGGQTCLAGDVIGDYAFAEPLRVGQRLVFEDMAYYTMVKTTTFNGINLPSIAIWNSQTDALRVVRRFGYEDFKGRLS